MTLSISVFLVWLVKFAYGSRNLYLPLKPRTWLFFSFSHCLCLFSISVFLCLCPCLCLSLFLSLSFDIYLFFFFSKTYRLRNGSDTQVLTDRHPGSYRHPDSVASTHTEATFLGNLTPSSDIHGQCTHVTDVHTGR